MAVITASIKVGGKPLRRAYVEHTGPFGVGSFGLKLTSDEGAFSFDAGLLANRVDVKIHCQNSVMRVIDGLRFGISVNANVGHGGVIRIRDYPDHFAILNSCLDVYDTVWRQFSPYRGSGRRKFAIKPENKLRDTFKSDRRLELTYPDPLAPDLAFVEPAGLTNGGLPLTHITDRLRDRRLFGEDNPNGTRNDPSLLPHELGHVFHFAAMAPNTRTIVEASYLGWLTGRIPSRDFYHGITKKTVPLVAYLEATGIFSERFYFFRKRVEPELTGDGLYKAFIEDELSEAPRLGKKLRATHRDEGKTVKSYVQVAKRNDRGSIDPNELAGNDVEGSVYGAMYLELASHFGLKTIVEAVLASNATTFDEFATYLATVIPTGREILLTKSNWGML